MSGDEAAALAAVMPGGIAFGRRSDPEEEPAFGWGTPEETDTLPVPGPGTGTPADPAGEGSLPTSAPVPGIPVLPATPPQAPVAPARPAAPVTRLPVQPPAPAPATEPVGTDVVDNPAEEGEPRKIGWADLYGIDPDYTDGVPVDEWLAANRGEAPLSVVPAQPVSTDVDTPAATPPAQTEPEAAQGEAEFAEEADAVVAHPHDEEEVPAGVDPVTGAIDADYTPAPEPGPATGAEAPVAPLGDLLITEEWTEDEFAEPVATPEAKPRKTRATMAVAITDRDVALLEFLGRYRYATYSQLALAFNTTGQALRHRMPRLAKQGLVTRRTLGRAGTGVWLPTDSGLRLAAVDLPTPVLKWGAVAHNLGLVDIGIRFEQIGETVVTEREIRAADTRAKPSQRMLTARGYLGIERVSTDVDTEAAEEGLFIVAMGGGESHYGHIPDMVLARPPAADGSPQSVAVELELAPKPPAQWRKILRAYKKAPHIGAVVYFTHRPKIANGIMNAAKDLNLGGFVAVQKYTPVGAAALPLGAAK